MLTHLYKLQACQEASSVTKSSLYLLFNTHSVLWMFAVFSLRFKGFTGNRGSHVAIKGFLGHGWCGDTYQVRIGSESHHAPGVMRSQPSRTSFGKRKKRAKADEWKSRAFKGCSADGDVKSAREHSCCLRSLTSTRLCMRMRPNNSIKRKPLSS